jgi:mRNA-degrading endonuclease RelE of RelBE toxin-antitoxin system
MINLIHILKKNLKKIKSDFSLQKRLQNKVEEILECPHHYKNLRNVLKNRQRVHIGSFVLIFEVIRSERLVIFHRFKHHDEVY